MSKVIAVELKNMKEKYEWIKIVYRDENGKKICSKWAKSPLQGNSYVDREMKKGIAEALQPIISWEIEETCITKPNLA